MERDGFSPIPKNLQFRVGLLLGLAIMVAAGFILYALFARGTFEATQRLTLVSDNAEGVSLGMDLTFSGFPIGRVVRIALADDGRAHIELEVPRKDARWLRVTSIFTLERGIVGGARIRAFSGNLQDPPLPDGAERPVLRGDTQEEIPRMDLEAIGRQIKDKKVCIGVVDHHTLQVETPDQVAALVRKALEHIPAERLILGSDCGMRDAGLTPQ